MAVLTPAAPAPITITSWSRSATGPHYGRARGVSSRVRYVRSGSRRSPSKTTPIIRRRPPSSRPCSLAAVQVATTRPKSSSAPTSSRMAPASLGTGDQCLTLALISSITSAIWPSRRYRPRQGRRPDRASRRLLLRGDQRRRRARPRRPGRASPHVIRRQSCFEPGGEDSGDQGLFGGEVPVEGSDTHAGAAGYFVDWYPHSLFGEDFLCRHEQPLTILPGVRTQGPCAGVSESLRREWRPGGHRRHPALERRTERQRWCIDKRNLRSV